MTGSGRAVYAEGMNTTPSLRRHAIVAGVSLLVMAVAAAFAYGFAYGTVIGSARPEGLAAAIADNEPLFRAGMAGWLVVLACDVIAACALYSFLAAHDASLSLLAMAFRLMYAAILAVALAFLMNAGHVVGDSKTANEAATFLVGVFKSTWAFGLILFGAHLALLGYALLRYRAAPKVISALLLLAAACYVFVHALRTFFPQYGAFASAAERALSAPMAVGEIAFAVWLVIRGGKTATRGAKVN